jgi:Holliday junction resolvasome RuvABC endonuclease subunit
VTILALDPATHTGWALHDGLSILASGTWDLSVRRDESGGMRLVRLRSKLRQVLEAFPSIALVVFESARHGAPKMQGALVVQSELQAVIKLWAQDRKLDFKGYSPSEIKKRATGKGNAGKDAMLAAARDTWPGWAGDDNEADARWLAVLVADEYGVTPNAAVAHG